MTLNRKPKGFMFDLDGTLILSNRKLGSYDAIPGEAEALGELDRLGIPWLALTTAVLMPPACKARACAMRAFQCRTKSCSRPTVWRQR